MIQSKQDLEYYLDEDRKAYGKPAVTSIRRKIVNMIFLDKNHAYMRCLRKLEYYSNSIGSTHALKRILFVALAYYYRWRLASLRSATGIELSPNCAGPGLHLSYGKVVISSIAKIGEHCKILSDVTIGGQGRYDVAGAPVIGDRVFVGSGAKIIGDIKIANDVVIGANAVVVRDILEPGITVAGNPASKVSNNGSYHYLNRQ